MINSPCNCFANTEVREESNFPPPQIVVKSGSFIVYQSDKVHVFTQKFNVYIICHYFWLCSKWNSNTNTRTLTFLTKFFRIVQWKKYNPDNQIIKYLSGTKVKIRKWVDKSGEKERKMESKKTYSNQNIHGHMYTVCTQINKQTQS